MNPRHALEEKPVYSSIEPQELKPIETPVEERLIPEDPERVTRLEETP